MKKLIAALFLFTHLNFVVVEKSEKNQALLQLLQPAAENIFIITTDGFRWQELFCGADSALLNNKQFTRDTELANLYYWSAVTDERRKKLMPFMWNVIASKGQIWGNRQYGNKAKVENIFGFSYPGYNEMLTGTTDLRIYSNTKHNNPNKNILEVLNEQERFKGKVAAVTSWDVFPYILHEKRSRIPVNSGYENSSEKNATTATEVINAVQQNGIAEKEHTRYDVLTFATAKEFIKQHEPKVMYIGLGETDEWAHKNRYDLYLQHAAEFDRMLADLWYFVQTHEKYKNKTAFIITTDHGRGYHSNWNKHGLFIAGSKEIWMAMIGPGIEAKGEIRDEGLLVQKNTPQLIKKLLGVDIKNEGERVIANAVLK